VAVDQQRGRRSPVVLVTAISVATIVKMFAVAVAACLGPPRTSRTPKAKAMLDGENSYPSALWPPIAMAILVWRYRDASGRAGLALGLACGARFLLWPLGVWLLATQRARSALVAALITVASLMLVLPSRHSTTTSGRFAATPRSSIRICTRCRPRLSAAWLVPLVTWGLPSSRIATDAIWCVGRVLLAFTIVLVAATRAEAAATRARATTHAGAYVVPH
jgi:hypothetical protein